jgi:3-oxoadipate enol-lactonase
LVKALVLSNSAAKMGTPKMWTERMAVIQQHGIGAMADTILDRWFGQEVRHQPQVGAWHAMLTRTPIQGYLGCCAAIASTDLTDSTAQLTLPALGIAGEQDGASPPELVAATCALIKGSTCHVIAKAGHLPCAENPVAYVEILGPFLKEHSHD